MVFFLLFEETPKGLENANADSSAFQPSPQVSVTALQSWLALFRRFAFSSRFATAS